MATQIETKLETLLLAFDQGVALITLSRPESYNSFNKQMALELQFVLSELKENKEVRCILLRGAGKAFCAGQDLKEVTSADGPPLTTIVRDHYNPIIESIRNMPKPVLAAVNGVAAGAGANIALACDVVVACESASFIQAFSKIGLIPDSGGTFILPRLVGFQKASALMMLGDKVSAREAEAMNMLYKVFPDADFESGSIELARRLAALPTKGLVYTKIALNQSAHNNLSQQLALEEQLQTKAGKTHDYNEGVASFLEKRKPNFTGE